MSALAKMANRARLALAKVSKGLSAVPSGRGAWWPLVREPFTGAWQQGVVLRNDELTSHYAVFACVTRIASDVAKLRPRLMMRSGAIWVENPGNSPFWGVLRKPNRYQTWTHFYEFWMNSRLLHGNAYALKARDARGVVVALYLLNPMLVRPMVAPDGQVVYQLGADDLNGLPQGANFVPASEIIHDRMNCLFHPLVGLSPIYACARAATQGLNIQDNSIKFFENMSRPSGVLTAPGQINDETAKRIKEHWDEKFGGANSGKIAVLGDSLKYEPMTMKATDAQLIEQLRMTGEQICTAFHVPSWKVGIGSNPTYQNAEVSNQVYYSDCLQSHIESIEQALDDGLSLPSEMRVEFELEDLLRMDNGAKMEFLAKAVGSAIYSPNEARAKFNLPPVPGGEAPYLQQQNYSLAALAKRDEGDPFAEPAAAPVAPPTPSGQQDNEDDDPDEIDDDVVAALLDRFTKGLQCPKS